MDCDVLVKNQDPVLDLKALKTYLRVDFGVEDPLIQRLLAAAQGIVESHIGQSLLVVTYGQTFSPQGVFMDDRPLRFEGGAQPLRGVRLMKTPIRSLDHVTVDGVPMVLDTVFFENARGEGKVFLPQLSPFRQLRVEYKAGLVSHPDLLPEGIRQALLRLVGHLYENRGEGTSLDFPIQGMTAQLLAPYRFMRL